MRSQSAMAKAMKGVTKAMSQMNAKMNLPQLQKIMMDFEREVSSKIHSCSIFPPVIMGVL